MVNRQPLWTCVTFGPTKLYHISLSLSSSLIHCIADGDGDGDCDGQLKGCW